MGMPGRTWFCENGHIAQSFGHHCLGIDGVDEGEGPCPHCGSTNLKCVTEWGDDDYGPFPVPYDPIKEEHKYITVTIRVYDVSKLFKKRTKDKKTT